MLNGVAYFVSLSRVDQRRQSFVASKIETNSAQSDAESEKRTITPSDVPIAATVPLSFGSQANLSTERLHASARGTLEYCGERRARSMAARPSHAASH